MRFLSTSNALAHRTQLMGWVDVPEWVADFSACDFLESTKDSSFQFCLQRACCTKLLHIYFKFEKCIFR